MFLWGQIFAYIFAKPSLICFSFLLNNNSKFLVVCKYEVIYLYDKNKDIKKMQY